MLFSRTNIWTIRNINGTFAGFVLYSLPIIYKIARNSKYNNMGYNYIVCIRKAKDDISFNNIWARTRLFDFLLTKLKGVMKVSMPVKQTYQRNDW